MAQKSDARETSKIDSQRASDWASYLEKGPVASPDFMEGIEDIPVQERESPAERLNPRRKNRN
jgi:hypothetical protein